MKRFLSLAIVCMCTTAATQAKINGNSEYSKEYKNWNRFQLSYTLTQAGSDEAFLELNGFELVYKRDIRISKHLPVALETGLGLEYRHAKEEMYIYDTEAEAALNMVSLSIPVNIKYNIRLSDNCSISPFCGLSTRLNVSGYISANIDDISIRLNMFNKNSKTLIPSSRLQASAKIGAMADIHHFTVGVSYSKDLSYFNYGVKLSSVNFSVGCRF